MVDEASFAAFDLLTATGVREWLTKLVATPSFSGEEADVVTQVVTALQPYSREAFVDAAGNAVAVVGSGPLTITMLGHLDTAPGGFPVRWEDGRLYGRGSVDAKGSAVALAVAMVRSGARVREACTLRFIGAVEEEAPSSRGARHALAMYPKPDHLIVGEPSGCDAVTLGYKGTLRSELSCEEAMAHGARATSNAIERLLEALAQVRQWTLSATPADSDAGERWFDRLQLSVLALHGNDDGLMQTARASLVWRLPPAWPPAVLVQALNDLALPEGVRWSHAIATAVPAVRGNKNGALARAFRTAIRVAGRTPHSKVKTGTSDWNVVASVDAAHAVGAAPWMVDALAYGPGDANLDHTPNEHLELRELEVAVDTLLDVFERLAGETTSLLTYKPESS